jgi:hypothetical protein
VQQAKGGGVAGDPYVTADVNKDGINDLTDIYYDPVSGTTNTNMYLGGTNNTALATPGTLNWAYQTGTGDETQETGTRFLDVNGDGKADVVEGIATSSGSTHAMYLGTYAPSTWYGFTGTSTYIGVIPNFAYNGGTYVLTTGIFGQVDGTGFPDFEQSLTSGTGYSSENGAYLGNGSAWNAATTTIFNPPNTCPTS